MRRYLPFAIIGAIFFLAIGSGLLLFRWKQRQQPSPTAATVPTVPIVQETPGVSNTLDTEGLHIRGGAAARVTLEEYGDFQCQPCARLFPALTTVERDYGERLRVIFRHKPLRKHEHAVVAACAAEAAGLQDRFWEMHDLLFQNSLRWTKGIDTVEPDASPSRRLQSNVLALETEVREVFLRYAEILKLDVERFKQDMDSDQVKARIESDRARGDALGINATPTIYLNGHLLAFPSATTVKGLRAAIDAELAGKTKEEPVSPSPEATPEAPK